MDDPQDLYVAAGFLLGSGTQVFRPIVINNRVRAAYRYRLGAVHDGSPPPTYLGGPGAEKCRWEDGYIMSDLRHTEKGFRWSPCSVSSFHHFLKCV